MVEWSLLAPEIRGSNPDNGKIYGLSTVMKRLCKMNTKRLGMVHCEQIGGKNYLHKMAKNKGKEE